MMLRPDGRSRLTSLFTGPSWIIETAPQSWLRAVMRTSRSTQSITEDALTIASTSMPGARPRFSTLAWVTTVTISVCGSRLMRTSASTGPGTSSRITPENWLRALLFRRMRRIRVWKAWISPGPS
ncbi:hypothetical protein D3C86_1900780 [compost metagenome]